MKTFKEFINEEANTVIASASVNYSGNNVYRISLYSNKAVYMDGGEKNKTMFALSNIFIKREMNGVRYDGTDEKMKAVKDLVKTAKNSKDLADKLNKSGMGYTNWKPV